MNQPITVEHVLELTKQLPLLDKLRLIERITPQIKRDLRTMRRASRKSLRDAWRGTEASSRDIDEAHREV